MARVSFCVEVEGLLSPRSCGCALLIGWRSEPRLRTCTDPPTSVNPASFLSREAAPFTVYAQGPIDPDGDV